MMRIKGLSRKLRLSRWAIVCLVVVVALGMLGVNLAYWTEALSAKQIKIDTSGSQAIDPGMTFGGFTVLKVETDEGKVTSLTLQYDGKEAASIEVRAGKDVVFEGTVDPNNNAFSFNGTAKDGELGKEVKIKVSKRGGGGGGGGGGGAASSGSSGGSKHSQTGDVEFVDPPCGGTLSSDPPGTNDNTLKKLGGVPPSLEIVQQDQDVGTTTVTHDTKNAMVVIDNGYPYYLAWASFYVRNSVSIPVILDDIVFAPSPGVLLDEEGLSIVAWVITITRQCGPCEGQVSWLRLRYNGDEAAEIAVVEKKTGRTVFDGKVQPDGEFEFIGTTTQLTLGTEISIYVNGGLNTKIHTSCSQPIGPGKIFGDFLVVAGESRIGGPLCPVNGAAECSQQIIMAGSYGEFTPLSDLFPGLTEENIIQDLDLGEDIIDRMVEELRKVRVDPGDIVDLHLLFNIEQWADQHHAIYFTITATPTQWTP